MFTVAVGISVPTVGDQGALPDNLPMPGLPAVPFTWDQQVGVAARIVERLGGGIEREWCDPDVLRLLRRRSLARLRRAARPETLRGPFRMVGLYDGGRFKDEIVPITIKSRKGDN